MDTKDDRMNEIDNVFKLIGSDYLSELTPNKVGDKLLMDFINGIITLDEFSDRLVEINNC